MSTQVVFPERSGRFEWSGRRASRRIESPPIDPRHATMQQRQVNRVEDGPTGWSLRAEGDYLVNGGSRRRGPLAVGCAAELKGDP